MKTSSGDGFVRQTDGFYSEQGATEHDLQRLRACGSAAVPVEAAGGVSDLGGLIRVRELGVARCDATAAAAILNVRRRREESGESQAAIAQIGKVGYSR